MTRTKQLLVGNSFPLSLITRRVIIEPVALEEFQAAAVGADIHSFWGHANTLAAAQAAMGIAFRPKTERPVVSLDSEGYPTLDGMSFTKCWIISPEYVQDFRPRIGEEVPLANIRGWRVLLMRWEHA